MEDKKSLKEKLKAHLPHKKGAEKKQTGTEDTGFTIRLARFIIEKRAWIESVFIAGCIFCAVAMLFVNVNYDLTKYVPSTAQSSMGLDVMKKEFGYPGTARLMLKDVSLYEAKQYKDKIQAIDGVDQVLWCDTTVNVYAGEDFINMDEIKDYYKDRCAVMDITFEEESDSPKTETAIDEMKAITGDKGCYVGMAVQNKSLIQTTHEEMNKILVVAVIMIFVVLCLATTAWTEPILFLLVMGVAVLLNKGTNIFIGTISFLTDNVAIILQLATSMDYSIFLLDAYMNWRDTGLSEEEAIVKAVEEAINSIFASSLTTVVGFLALVTMKFNIGFDMGLVLAKGIIFSLLTVVLFLPAMILKFAEFCAGGSQRYDKVALVYDVRTANSPTELFDVLDVLKHSSGACSLLFLEAEPETIIKRYKETRRRHPLMSDGMTIEQAMHREQELLRPLREHADFIIDTTLMPAAKLRNELYGLFGDKSARSKLSVNVVSFGFKYGIPLEADLVFDVRFLPNPFYVPDLKRKTGMDSEVYDYVFSFPQTKTFIEKLEGMLSFLLPLYAEEGKSTLVIAVGCTGGHHRSVSVARCVAAYLTELGYPAFENHRDITRG